MKSHTASSRSSWLVGAVIAATAACGNGGGVTELDAKQPDDSLDRAALLRHLGTKIISPAHDEFASAASALTTAITAHCAALDAGAPADTLATARTAWATAMDRWEVLEMLLVGPAAMDNKAARDLVYGWPLVATCGIDKDVASRWSNPSAYDLSTKLTNVRSLSAIEYLLFVSDAAHTCAASPAGWDALGADLPKARCRLAEVLAGDVAERGQTLATAWRADGGNFSAELAGMGQGGLNLVSDAMFYVDRMVKDMKLAETTGIAINACGTVQEPCVREVELRYADRGTHAIRTNLVAFRAALTGTVDGTEGIGFDDFLVQLGHADLATRMTTNLDAAIATADALPDSFLGALSSKYSDVAATHAAIKLVTDDLKSQFLTVLGLDIPDDVAADND